MLFRYFGHIYLQILPINLVGNADFDIDFTIEEESPSTRIAENGCGVTFKDRFLYLGGAGGDTRQV